MLATRLAKSCRALPNGRATAPIYPDFMLSPASQASDSGLPVK